MIKADLEFLTLQIVSDFAWQMQVEYWDRPYPEDYT